MDAHQFVRAGEATENYSVMIVDMRMKNRDKKLRVGIQGLTINDQDFERDIR